MSAASRRIRVTGDRRDAIDTDRLAALLLRAALRRETSGDVEHDGVAVAAALEGDTDDDQGESAA